MSRYWNYLQYIHHKITKLIWPQTHILCIFFEPQTSYIIKDDLELLIFLTLPSITSSTVSLKMKKIFLISTKKVNYQTKITIQWGSFNFFFFFLPERLSKEFSRSNAYIPSKLMNIHCLNISRQHCTIIRRQLGSSKLTGTLFSPHIRHTRHSHAKFKPFK